MKFKLEIELGNDAMQTFGDIAWAVRRAVDAIEQEPDAQAGRHPAQKIRDVNGNTVGSWEVVK